MQMNNSDKITRIERALDLLSALETDCTLCPRECHVDRRADKTGVCRTGNLARVSHALLHFGEEPVLSGRIGAKPHRKGLSPAAGSGTVFFAGCNLMCLFCQNYQLSWLNEGRDTEDEELAGMMLDLEARGALNINLVSPTHVILPILRGLKIAYSKGLSLPLVYNSNGYESLQAIRALDGIVDIYLPDLKYRSPHLSRKYAGAADYFPHASKAVLEMYCQQPSYILDENQVARSGVIIRHLVLPGCVEDSLAVLDWISEKISPFVGLSLMSQFHPCHKAPAELRRPLTREEYKRVADHAANLGFENAFVQPEPFSPDEHLIPDFRKKVPFRWK